MPNRFALRLSCAVALVSALSCAADPAPDAPAAQPQKDATSEVWDVIGAAWRWHIQSAQRKDLEAALEIYAPDIVYVSPDEPPVRGIDAVREMEANAFATTVVVEAVHKSHGIHVFDDVAYEVGTIVGPVRVADDPPRIVRYRFMAMWQRGADDGWRIRYIVGQAPPDDTPGPD